MCVFFLLVGKKCYVFEVVYVWVYQIWMGDCVDDVKVVSYSVQDFMIVECDIGCLVKYMFDMGGVGDLFLFVLSILFWEDLYELDVVEFKFINLVIIVQVDDVLLYVDIFVLVMVVFVLKIQVRFEVELEYQLLRLIKMVEVMVFVDVIGLLVLVV